MKVNAPEKIYLQVYGDYNDNDCKSCKFEDVEDNVTWCKDKIFKEDIEYTRTDAFIEKACGWLKEQDEMIGVSFQEDFIERFKNYMKGK